MRIIIASLLFLSLSTWIFTLIIGTTLFTPSAVQQSGGEHGLWGGRLPGTIAQLALPD